MPKQISECARHGGDLYDMDYAVGDCPVCQQCHEESTSIKTKLAFVEAILATGDNGDKEFFEFLNEWSWDDDSPVPGLLDDYIKWSGYDFDRWAVFGELKKVDAYG